MTCVTNNDELCGGNYRLSLYSAGSEELSSTLATPSFSSVVGGHDVPPTTAVSSTITLSTILYTIDSSSSTTTSPESSASQIATSGRTAGSSSSVTIKNSTSARPTPETTTATWTILINTTLVQNLTSTTVTRTFSAGTYTSAFTTVENPAPTEPSTLTQITTVTRTGYTTTISDSLITYTHKQLGTTYTSTYIYPPPSYSPTSNRAPTASSTSGWTLTNGEYSTPPWSSHNHTTKSLQPSSGFHRLTHLGRHNSTGTQSGCHGSNSASSNCFTARQIDITTSSSPVSMTRTSPTSTTETAVDNSPGFRAGVIAAKITMAVCAVLLLVGTGFLLYKWMRARTRYRHEERWGSSQVTLVEMNRAARG